MRAATHSGCILNPENSHGCWMSHVSSLCISSWRVGKWMLVCLWPGKWKPLWILWQLMVWLFIVEDLHIVSVCLWSVSICFVHK